MTATLARIDAAAGEPEAWEYRQAVGRQQALPYRLVRPEGVEADKKYPLVLLLHGGGERGSDNAKTLVWFWDAKKPSLLTREEFVREKAFAVIPQCPDGKQWVDVPWDKGSYTTPKISEPLKLTFELLDALLVDLPIDPDRVYVTGLSMGGYGTFDMVQRRPDLFAAAVPVCGGGDPSRAVASVPFWVFHGEKDQVVPVSGSRDMVAALRKAKGKPRYTEYAGVGHNSWSPAFEERELWSWLFAQRRPARKLEKKDKK